MASGMSSMNSSSKSSDGGYRTRGDDGIGDGSVDGYALELRERLKTRLEGLSELACGPWEPLHGFR